jgi:hypothetical protein
MDPLLAAIHAALNKHPIDSIEHKRVTKDLESILTRLNKKDYDKGGITNSVFDVPDRTQQFYINLEFYCNVGKTWARLLNTIDLNAHTRIADLCSGHAPKIELALFYKNYTGTVVTLDKNADSQAQLSRLIALFNPQFTLEHETLNILEDSPQKSFSLGLGNHIIDDLVMDYFGKKWSISWSQIYEQEGALKKLWTRILESANTHHDEVTPHLAQALNQIIENQGLLILAQYESYIERLLELKQVNPFNQRVLQTIKTTLIREYHFQDRHNLIQDNFNNPGNTFTEKDCVILQRKKSL